MKNSKITNYIFKKVNLLYKIKITILLITNKIPIILKMYNLNLFLTNKKMRIKRNNHKIN